MDLPGFSVSRELRKLGNRTSPTVELSLDESVRYAKEREAFGKPIGRFGQIQYELAQMRIRLEAPSSCSARRRG